MLSEISRSLAAVQENFQVEKQKVVCDTVTGLADSFEADRYMGKWYEIYHSQNQIYQPDSWKCVTADYTDLKDDGTFKVYNSSKAKYWLPRFGVHGDGKCPADEAEGSCLVRFFAPIAPWPQHSNYQIVDTDYENYTIVYACEFNFQYLWIMSRTPTITEDFEQELLSKAFAYLPNYETSNLVRDV